MVLFLKDSIPELYKYFPESIDTNAMLVTELFGTNLLTLRNNFKPLSTPTIMRIGLQIVSSITHSLKTVHPLI